MTRTFGQLEMKILPAAVDRTFMTGQKATPFYKWEYEVEEGADAKK